MYLRTFERYCEDCWNNLDVDLEPIDIHCHSMGVFSERLFELIHLYWTLKQYRHRSSTINSVFNYSRMSKMCKIRSRFRRSSTPVATIEQLSARVMAPCFDFGGSPRMSVWHYGFWATLDRLTPYCSEDSE
jgi:hypothetical protein